MSKANIKVWAILIIVNILALWLLGEIKKPDCADAQSCVPIPYEACLHCKCANDDGRGFDITQCSAVGGGPSGRVGNWEADDNDPCYCTVEFR